MPYNELYNQFCRKGGIFILRMMIIGAGGVGGYLAGKLARQYDGVTVVARGAHLAAIQAQGLTIQDGDERFTVHPRAIEQPAEASVQDAIFLCTKGYGLEGALEQIRPCVGPDTMIIPLLNGVNMHKRIAAALPQGKALLGSIYIYANIVSPGVISKNGPMLRLLLGIPGVPGSEAPAPLQKLCGLLNDAGIPTELPEDMLRENWIKWAVLVSNGQPNAYFNAPLGAIREDPARMEFVMALLNEVMAVAVAEGVALPEDMPERLLTTMRSLPYESVSSLARDIATPGKPTELSLFAGTLCELAEAHGIDTPANRSVLETFRDRL